MPEPAMPTPRLLALALAAACLAAPACVAPPRPEKPIEAIPPRPLSVVTLPPMDGGGGNGFAGPEALPPAPVGSQAGGSYTVAKGDTLAGIARRFYGNASAWKRIAAANPGIDPNRIQAGQVLVLP